MTWRPRPVGRQAPGGRLAPNRPDHRTTAPACNTAVIPLSRPQQPSRRSARSSGLCHSCNEGAGSIRSCAWSYRLRSRRSCAWPPHGAESREAPACRTESYPAEPYGSYRCGTNLAIEVIREEASTDCCAPPSSPSPTRTPGPPGRPPMTPQPGTLLWPTAWTAECAVARSSASPSTPPGDPKPPRPAVVVSNDAANATATRLGRGVITVVPVTSNTTRVYPFQVPLPARQTGLPHDSKAPIISLARRR
jgi:PemK-like, MazF-like toxin of type II toxin-antitoxin system